MTNGWNKESYVQGFDYESITFSKSVNIFEHIKMYENIY